MTNKEAIKNIKALAYYVDEPIPEDVAKAFDMAIKALEEVEGLPENLHREREQAYMNGYADGYKRGEEEQERPTGEWVHDYDDFYHCSICKRSITTTLTRPTDLFPFCHCGAEMKEAENEDQKTT